MYKVEFEKSVPSAKLLPRGDLPEILFIGRSNVGKSTLINDLLETTGLARTSRTPGRTAMANLFLIEDQLRFVDLPGYGYAKAAKNDRKAWQELVSAFLARECVGAVLFLIDSRRLFAEGDIAFFDSLADHHPVTLVITKIDKLNQRELNQQQKSLEDQLEELSHPPYQIHWIGQKRSKPIEYLRKQILRFEIQS